MKKELSIPMLKKFKIANATLRLKLSVSDNGTLKADFILLELMANNTFIVFGGI
jgi:hypothetical protein